MVQTLVSRTLVAGQQMIFIHKPHILHRIFFSARVLLRPEQWADVKMSFDDPLFHSYYILNGPEKYFEATGADIFQGNVWAFNNSDINLWLLMTEILH